MFENRRSEIEIIGDILKLSNKGAKKTEILYRGNLSYHQLQNYLSFLIRKNILEEKNVNNNRGNPVKIYQTTSKGKNLLDDIDNMLDYFK
jgi:predicted transcriptional regulator